MAYAATIRATHRSARILGTFEVDGTLNAAVLKVAGLTMLGGALTTYTQTYSTAAATVPAAISATLVLTATNIANKTASLTLTESDVASLAAMKVTNDQMAKDIGTAMNLISADLLAVKKLVNQIIDDLQLQGLAL